MIQTNEIETNQAWIILHTWSSTYDWYGSCPCKPHDFFVTEGIPIIPKTFDSKEDAEKYIKLHYLSERWTKVVQIAG